MNATVGFLADCGGVLLLSTTLMLTVGWAAMRLSTAPVHRQRLGEVALLGTLLWVALACVPWPGIKWSGVQWPGPRQEPAASPVRPDLGHRTVRVPTRSEPAPARALAEIRPMPERFSAPARPSSWRRTVATVYMAGVAGCVVWLLTGRVALAYVLRTAREGEPWLAGLYGSLQVRSQDKRPRLLVSSRCRRPIVFGIWRPTIILPGDICSPQTEPHLRHVLLHEMAHVWRADAWGNVLLHITFPLLYFHPLYWWLRTEVGFARELIADDWAAGFTTRASYAEELIRLARRRRGGLLDPSGALAVFRPRTQFYRRMTMLIDRKRPLATKASTTWRASTGLGCVLAMGLSVLLFGLPGAVANHDEGESARDKAEKHADASRNDRAWAPGQATGPPNTGEAGDFPTAWASDTPDGQDEWLELRYASPILATKIVINETYNPGALEAVSVFKPGGEEVKVWTGKPTPTGGGKRVTEVPVETGFAIDRVKLYIASKAVPGWNEIDAVGITDEHGKTHWAASASASSSYGGGWAPEEATGAPNTPEAGDFPTAWASQTPDDQDEWLELSFASAVRATAIKVYETFNPGALEAVSVFKPSGDEVKVWTGEPGPTGEERRESLIPVQIDFGISRVKLYIASKVVPGWNEVDAVGIVDADGKTHWATEASASSTFAQGLGVEGMRAIQQPLGFWAKYVETDVWAPEQATGAPNTPEAGDFPTAWASRTPDDQDEWLELSFASAVRATAIEVYETFNPGALKAVSVFKPSGDEVKVWTGEPGPTGEEGRVSSIPVQIAFSISRVKLYIASKEVPGWNEIDAVGIVDPDGRTHWATEASASSTYAEWLGAAGMHAILQPFGFSAGYVGADAWAPEQATGAPNTSQAGDFPTAWASLTEDEQDEWLELTFDSPIRPTAIHVHETFNPGALEAVSVFKPDGQEVRVWTGDPSPADAEKQVTAIPVETRFDVSRLKLYIASKAVPGWNEIDAVGIVDGSGATHWATAASASSTFAQP